MLNWRQENNLWFCYKDGVKLISQWIQDNNKWYYLDKDGRLSVNWFQTAKNGDTWFYAYDKQTTKDGKIFYTGEIITGWVQLNNKWYFLEDKNADTLGSMYCNGTYTIDEKEYTFDKDGVWIEDSNDSLVSEECINFVKGYEAFYSYKYDDGTGVITQGYGCIGDEISDWGDTITEQQASDRLKELINNNYAKPIKEYLDSKGISLTQSQQDALYSCAYNIGVGSLEGSSLMRYIVSGGRDSDTITTDFCMWDRAGGQEMNGLKKRRIAEANIFNNGVYDSTH